MKLNDFLLQGRPAATRSVTFRVLGNDAGMNGVVADARAELAYVSEHVRHEAMREADAALREAYAGKDPQEDRRNDERTYHVLCRALRDADDVRQPFAGTVRELKGALVLAEAHRIWAAYADFMDEEFPDEIDAETFEKLVADSKKNTLADLISSYGYAAVRRLMSGSRATPVT